MQKFGYASKKKFSYLFKKKKFVIKLKNNLTFVKKN